MTAQDESSGTPSQHPQAGDEEPYQGLQKGSYTEQQLRHASAHHLHMTSRRFFIGPIPKGWINGHRKSWYRARLQFKNYSSKTLSFSIDPVAAHYNQGQTDGVGHVVNEPAQEAILTLRDSHDAAASEDESATESVGSEDDTPGELRTLSHPVSEDDVIGTDSEAERTTGEIATSTEGNEVINVHAEGGSASEEDSDATPRASARPRSRHDGSPSDDDDHSSGDDNTASSYVTAREDIASSVNTDHTSSTVRLARPSPGARQRSQGSQHLRIIENRHGSPLTPSASAAPSEADSTTRLLKSRPQNQRSKSKASAVSKQTLERQEPQNEDDAELESHDHNIPRHRKITKKVTRFNLDDNVLDKKQRLRSRINRTHGAISTNRPRRRKVQDGEIIKAEKMLVLVEETLQDTLPEDYQEKDSLRMESRLVDDWKEYLVVCRKGSTDDSPFVLQMYRTRVIPDAQNPKNKSKPFWNVRLDRKTTRVNLYSALDKTIVIWHSRSHGNKMFIIRPKSTAHATEWYTLIRQILGWRRPDILPINVPDLGVSLVFNNPFGQLEERLGVKSDKSQHTTVLGRAAAQEGFVASNIIKGCIDLLQDCPEWCEVLKSWSKTQKMGLAWKRYDRIEWIYGVQEENMYGTMAMLSAHELELRPRHHYPTTISNGGAKEEEPPPVEGFLIRLTSQKGLHQRMHKMFYKRLYFYTQDHLMFFCRPARAIPPGLPRFELPESSELPTTRQIMDQMPMWWDVEPYALEDGEISWLKSGNPEFVRHHDEEALAQYRRNVHNIGQAEGYIDLCKVTKVRNMRPCSSPADPNMSEGPSVNFHPEPDDDRNEDGTTKDFESDRVFELVLENGLVIRLQAFDQATRDQWVKGMEALVNYWRKRCFEDAAELHSVRQRNLKILEIDEELESAVGQFAQKWELRKAEASPHLHNMCLLAGCRPIKMAGQLYRKPRRHATFAKCQVVLTAGKLVIFRSTLRQRSGTEVPHIHQDLDSVIDLNNCYIYSGLATEADLLYANETFDNNNPGVSALPRVYLASDTFTSRDEDTATTFVIWQPRRKNYFRAEHKVSHGKSTRSLRHVSALGKNGRSIVFMARSRMERDRWVLSISSEMDRLQEEMEEEIRIVPAS
ncbi:hypothetical protein N7539_007906 [Penicillium diatomitis]|uniref:PH domain-containing protein n=1 Tax=Penicillium diatomitis TaxID=2819901 RepID=A0A9X0BNJ7_9EURO|nr:uncharacterized protein N7539_007906 [Penicillium diatomitis]KAJ5475619.1 hypothetical protein N7539_007906 [Penicillium diatomitis]